jgi:hypothetical protein
MKTKTLAMIACILLLLTVNAFSGAPGETPAVPAVELPEKVAVELARDWKLERIAERSKQPGATGQHDVFWQLLQLCEHDARAREDVNIEALMDWLLFAANLWTEPSLREPAYSKLPVLIPKLGARLLGKRLSSWISAVGLRANGNEPWAWTEFPTIDKTALAGTVRHAMESESHHNPLVRVWLAAALLACEDPEGARKLAAARNDVEKGLPQQAVAFHKELTSHLADNGVRAALPLVLQQAEFELSDPTPDARRFSGSLSRFYQLLGWTIPSNPVDPKVQLANAREWLSAHQSKLSWDRNKRRYTTDAPPPGMAALYEAASAAEKKFGFKSLEGLTAGQAGHSAVMCELLALMEKNPDIDKDPIAGDLLIALLSAGATAWYLRDNANVVLSQLPKRNPGLGTRVWAAAIRGAMAANPMWGAGDLVGRIPDVDASILNNAFANLLPEYEKAYEKALKTGDVGASLNAAMHCLLAGGKPDRGQLLALLATMPADWAGNRQDSKLQQWYGAMFRAGRIGALRLLLIEGEFLIAKYEPKAHMHPLQSFQRYVGWIDYEAPVGTAEEQLARCTEWLAKNETALKWDPRTNRFGGALSPEKALLAQSMEPLKKLGFDTASCSYTRDGLRDTCRNLLAFLDKEQDARLDPAVEAATLALAEMAVLSKDTELSRTLVPNLPRLNPAAAVKVYACIIRSVLCTAAPPTSSVLDALNQRLPGAVPTLVSEANALLLPELKKLLDAATEERPEERMRRALAYLFAGGKEEVAFDQMLIATGKLRDLPRPGLGLNEWAQTMCRNGNLNGLKLFLTMARMVTQQRAEALLAFEESSGISQIQPAAQGLRDCRPEVLLSRLDADTKWLQEHEKDLVFDAIQRRFKFTVAPPPLPQAEVRPTPPRAPPRPVDGQGEF